MLHNVSRDKNNLLSSIQCFHYCASVIYSNPRIRPQTKSKGKGRKWLLSLCTLHLSLMHPCLSCECKGLEHISVQVCLISIFLSVWCRKLPVRIYITASPIVFPKIAPIPQWQKDTSNTRLALRPRNFGCLHVIQEF